MRHGFHQEMYMIFFSIGLDKPAIKIFAYPEEMIFQSFNHKVREYFFSVFGNKDQMQVKIVNDMSFCANILHDWSIFSILI